MPAGADPGPGHRGPACVGHGQQADLLSGMTLTPGDGIDFRALGMVLDGRARCSTSSRRSSAGCRPTCSTAITQRTVYRLREEVEAKINRLPLKYFDGMQRGELLSRVTNDIDNISQTLQQTLSQLLTSLLTVIGVVVMMFIVSPLLALIALVTIPLTLVVTMVIARALAEAVRRPVEAHGRAQRPDRGGLHRSRPGQGVRSSPRGRGAVPARRTKRCTRRASARSSSRASSCRP